MTHVNLKIKIKKPQLSTVQNQTKKAKNKGKKKEKKKERKVRGEKEIESTETYLD